MSVYIRYMPDGAVPVQIVAYKSRATIFSKTTDGETFDIMLADFRELTREHCAFPCLLVVDGLVCASTADEF
jgi:hypothetical protein